MQLTSFFGENQILLRLEEKDKNKVFERLIGSLNLGPGAGESNQETLRSRISKAVFDREATVPTGLGNGLAFPHARVDGLKNPAVAFAFLSQPIEYGSVDEKPVDIVCLMAVPTEAPTVVVKMTALLIQFLCRAEKRTALMEASSPADVLRMFNEEDFSIDIPVTAENIMREDPLSVRVDTPLKDVTHLMHEHHLNALPVTDNDGKVIGEINCENLFSYGLPDFFSQLKSVSFIRDFDPFEKYFEKESSSQARDVMCADPAVFPTTATLLEIVFSLAVKRHINVYIVHEDGVLIGIIDRTTVLDKILNL